MTLLLPNFLGRNPLEVGYSNRMSSLGHCENQRCIRYGSSRVLDNSRRKKIENGWELEVGLAGRGLLGFGGRGLIKALNPLEGKPEGRIEISREGITSLASMGQPLLDLMLEDY